PPGSVGAELEAAAVFELVDRPHQAGVSFLNEVEERKAAVAVLLGDGDHQTEVTLGEAPLRLLIVGVDLAEVAYPAAEAGGGFLQRAEDVAILDEERLAVGEALALLLHDFELLLQVIDPLAELGELVDHRLDPLGPQAEFLDKDHGPTATAAESLPGGTALGL